MSRGRQHLGCLLRVGVVVLALTAAAACDGEEDEGACAPLDQDSWNLVSEVICLLAEVMLLKRLVLSAVCFLGARVCVVGCLK